MALRRRRISLCRALVLVAVLFTVVVGQGYADRNVPPGPIAGPDSQAVPAAPALRPLPRGGVTRSPAPEDLGGIISDPLVGMKVLVLYKSGEADGVYAMIQAALEILGVPYNAIDTGLGAPDGTVEENDLWDGVNRGFYQAVFITTSNVWSTHLDATERSLIEAYERAFNVRQVTLYAFPNAAEYGLVFQSVAPSPLNAALTAEGQAVFSYLRPDVSIPFIDVYGYQAQPEVGADVTTLMQDPAGHTLLAVFRPGDGREHMALTMSSFYPAIPRSNIHARLLPYGMITWATRGVFLGQRHVYFAPQPDDALALGNTWDPISHQYVQNNYRNEPSDLDNLVGWMVALRASKPNAAGFRIEMPFNAREVFEGDPPEVVNGQIVPNTLTAKAVELQSQFTWLNHTYSHADLDFASYTVCSDEISHNNSAAAMLGFTDFSQATLLTGDYSGMGRSNPPTAPNANLASAAYSAGVRYILVNESDPLFKNPSPNTGIPHPLQSQILEVPRYANNIFYSPTNPTEEVDLYNWIYCPGYAADPINTPLCYDYEYIIDSVTNQALGFMLDFSINPTMFHMNNLDAYDAEGHTLMTDFIEALYGKYNTYYNNNVPVLSLRTQEIGANMRDRMAYNAAGISGELACGNQITLRTVNATRIPVTGISYGSNVETYAGQPISTMVMAAGATLVIAGEPVSVAAAISDLSAERSGDDVLLTWTPTSVDTQGTPLSALAYRVYGHPTNANFTPGPATLLGEVAVPYFAHLGAGNDPATYTYLVTAIGDNCWKRESEESNRVTSLPLAVTVAAFSATALDDAVLVQWETASEIDNLGFNLYRGLADSGPWTQLNTALIPSQAPGSGQGFSYDYLDSDATAGVTYYYLLGSVDLAGAMAQHGPISVVYSGAPTAVDLVSLAAEPATALDPQVVAALVLASLALAGWSRRERVTFDADPTGDTTRK